MGRVQIGWRQVARQVPVYEKRWAKLKTITQKVEVPVYAERRVQRGWIEKRVKVWDYKTVRYLKGYRTVYDYQPVRVWRGGRWVQEIREVPSRRVPIYGRKRVRAGWHWETRREPRWVTEQVQIDTRIEERTIERWGWVREKVGERTVYESVPRYVERRVRQGEEERWVLERLPDPPPPAPTAMPAQAAEPSEAAGVSSDENGTHPYLGLWGLRNDPIEPTSEEISRGVGLLGKLIKYSRKIKRIREVAPLQFRLLEGDYVSVRTGEEIATGSKIAFRQKLGYAGTRYSRLTAVGITSSQLWKRARSNKALGISFGLAVVQNVVDYGWGEHREKGLKEEFFASTLVDVATAGVAGLAAAGSVSLVMTGAAMAGLTAVAGLPLVAVLIATAAVGYGLGIIADHLIEKYRVKEKVAEGFGAWGGIASNAGTIVRVGADRLGDAVVRGAATAQETVAGLAQSTVDIVQSGYDRVARTTSGWVEDGVNAANEFKDNALRSLKAASEGLSNAMARLFGGGK
jgi:hypothetical protein